MDDVVQVPPIVKALAEKEGKLPLSWWVASDHMTIVYQDGRKVTYDRDLKFDKPAAAAAEETAAPAPIPPGFRKVKPRTSKKK